MLILAIDSSRKTPSFTVFDQEQGKVLISNSYQGQSSLLIEELIKSFQQKGLAPKSISLILVSKGPGSFTGIRNALSIAKTLATQLQIPFITFNNFELLRSNSEALCIRAGLNDFFVSLNEDYDKQEYNFYSTECPPHIPLVEIDQMNLSQRILDKFLNDPSLIKRKSTQYQDLQPYYLREPSINKPKTRSI